MKFGLGIRSSDFRAIIRALVGRRTSSPSALLS